MIQKFLRKLLEHRHFWRYATFSEISELYTSRMLRTVALNMSSAFMSIFMYQNGYSVFSIAFFWGCYFLLKVFLSLPMAAVVGRFGPKHGILMSNLLFIPGLIGFALLPEWGAWLLLIVALFQGLSTTLYSISYGVDFSKVKSVHHAGKEIAYMNIIEKIATGISPLIGGFLAFFVGPQIVLLVAALLFGLAAVPLLKTAEPTLPNQKLLIRGFPWKLVTPNIASQMALGFDVFTSGTAWLLFTGISIIGISANNEIYAANGILLSVILFSALGASYAYGKLIDRRRGGELLRISAVANSLVHFSRAFIVSPVGVAGLNIANEAATTGYTMAYTRGVFDNADLSGRRVTYLGVVELLSNLGAACGALFLGMLVLWVGDVMGMQRLFFVAGIVLLLVATARFQLYRK